MIGNSSVHRAGSTSTTKIVRGLNAATRIVRSTLQTRSLTYLRLYVLAKRIPYYVPGVFRFPFGPVHYVDIGSLPFLYYEIFIDGIYEFTTGETSPRIIDCGGNIGMSTIWFTQHYRKARITTFEADPTIADTLIANVRSLRLDRSDVVQAAVSSHSGTVTFSSDGAIGGRIAVGSGVSVSCVRLSDYINEQVDLLKLDIEGSEFEVITDLCVTGKIDLVQRIVCEVHGRSDTQARMDDLWADLTSAGFHLTVNWAKAATDAPDPVHSTPFPNVASSEFVLLLYAWKP